MHNQQKREQMVAGRRRRSGGFTLVELLVVIGLIVVLVTLLIVALASASGRAGAARTAAVMQSMAQGMTRFREDFGYLPPILGHRDPAVPVDMRDLYAAPPDPNRPQFGVELQTWFSITSPAEYLLGYGDERDDGARGPGIRSPGLDGYWGGSRDANTNGTVGEFEDRRPPVKGQVYGPYLELSDDRFLGALDINTGRVFLPSESGYDPAWPKVVVDYWGEPIRYYVDHPDRRVNLGDVILLRPWSIPDGAQAIGVADASGSTATTYTLKSAAFAFFSTGEDRVGNTALRVDDPNDPNNTAGTVFKNKDNIVEVGQ